MAKGLRAGVDAALGAKLHLAVRDVPPAELRADGGVTRLPRATDDRLEFVAKAPLGLARPG